MQVSLAVTIGLLITGCGWLGENVVVAEGDIVSPQVIDGQCELSLVSLSDNSVLQSRKIGSTFATSFVVAPARKEYYLAIDCPGHERTRSRQFVVGGSKDAIDVTIDMGTIELAASNPYSLPPG